MALVIRGETKCQFCGNVLDEAQELISFPHFVANEMDPLWLFCDGAFHAECFYAHPLAQVAQRRYEDIVAHNGPGNRACVVCKNEINTPDRYFTLGHLTEDPTAALYRYNYVQAHSSCLPKWRELASVITLIRDLKESGTWKGDVLDHLLIELEKAISRKSTI